MTSPLGASPRCTRRAVSGLTLTTARATARRSVACLAPTSTMRARPDGSRWVSSLTPGPRESSGGGCGRVAVGGLRGFDQLTDAADLAGAQQRDRIGLP